MFALYYYTIFIKGRILLSPSPCIRAKHLHNKRMAIGKVNYSLKGPCVETSSNRGDWVC